MEQFIYTPYTEVEENKPKNLRPIISKYLYHWPIFVLSIIITLTLGAIYLKNSRPVYNVKAKLAIKDEKNKTATDKAAALEQLNISTEPKLAESELEILKSRPLINTIVNDLQLWCNYYEEGTYTTYDIYATTPVQFKLLKPKGILNDFEFKVTFKNLKDYTVTLPTGKTINASFRNTFDSSFGKWKLIPNSNLNNYVGKTITVSLRNIDKVATEYQTNILATLKKTNPIIELEILDEVPERGKKVINHLITVYKNFNIIDKNKETESTLKFIDERLASLTEELTDAEKNVEGYKSSIGLTDISSKSKFYLDNVQSNDLRLNEVRVQLNVIEGIENYVNSENNGESIPATLGITDPGLVSMVDQLTKLKFERDKQLAITPAGNPIFIPLNRQIASVETAIKENIRNIKSSLKTSRKQFEQINSGFESSIKNIPGQERQYVSIKRQQGIKESLYIYLLEKREEIALSYASTLTDARTVEEAYFEDPISKKAYTLSIALLLGLLIPTGFIYSRETIKNKIVTRKEIEAATSAPIISEIVYNLAKSPLVIQQGRDNFAIGEQFRTLRTNLLEINNRKEKGKVTLFTSSIPGEGKSFVASNMAVSLSVLGKKTILLELDLRKPKITNFFKLDSKRPGLSDFLGGNAKIQDIIQPSGLNPHLNIMGAGTIPANPSELLESREMELLIEELKYEYDNILIDSPPLHLVTDAMILAPLADATLYIIRQGYTGKEELQFIKRIQEENKLPNMKIIFNGIQSGKYGYGHHYNYSYYNDKEKKSASTHMKEFFNRF